MADVLKGGKAAASEGKPAPAGGASGSPGLAPKVIDSPPAARIEAAIARDKTIIDASK